MTLEEEAALPAQVRWEGRFIQAITQGRWEYVARARGIQAAVILAFDAEDRVILVEQFRVPLARRCLELPAGLVGDEDAGEPVALAAARGATEGAAIARALAAGAMQAPRRLHLSQLALELGDALLDQASVRFDLRLAGTAHEAEPAALAFEMGPGADQARALVVEMRKLDLERALPGLGAAAEDFQNEPGAVEHLGLPFLLEVALLDRR